MTDHDGPARRAGENGTTMYPIMAGPGAERLVRALLLGPLKELPDIATEAFVRGLIQLANDRGLEFERDELRLVSDDEVRHVAESAAIAREASLLAKSHARIAMGRLAEAFPSLRCAPGARPWDPHALDAWLASSHTRAARAAAAFVLGVWDDRAAWSAAFDAHCALGDWDDAHRAAFLTWASAPWWPPRATPTTDSAETSSEAAHVLDPIESTGRRQRRLRARV